VNALRELKMLASGAVETIEYQEKGTSFKKYPRMQS